MLICTVGVLPLHARDISAARSFRWASVQPALNVPALGVPSNEKTRAVLPVCRAVDVEGDVVGKGAVSYDGDADGV